MTAGWLSSHINDAITAAGQNLQGNSTVQSPKWTYNANFNYTPEIGNGLRLTVGADANWRSSQYYNAENTPSSLEPGYWLADAHVGIGGTNQLWTVTAFIKNIGNRVYRTYVNDLPSFGWVLNIYGQPRTFGAALNVRF
jgi:iron complex outermembrane receptor protein